MYSRRSERGLGMMAVACAIFGATSPSPAVAKEAMHRGDAAVITWVDERGATRTAHARGVTYAYWDRRYLSVPKNGVSYKDKLVEEKGLPLAGGFVKFTVVDTIEFTWETDPETRSTQLRIDLIYPKEKHQTAHGGELAGATHPKSPYIWFKVDGSPVSIELEPMHTEEERRGHPRLVSIAFYVIPT